jgi:phosphoglycerate kinase
LESPERPFGGLFGGAKVSDKVAALDNIVDKLDFLLIGGAMAALFLKAAGHDIG